MKKIVIALGSIAVLGAASYGGGVLYAANKAKADMEENKKIASKIFKKYFNDQVSIENFKISNQTPFGATTSFDLVIKKTDNSEPIPNPEAAVTPPEPPAPDASPEALAQYEKDLKAFQEAQEKKAAGVPPAVPTVAKVKEVKVPMTQKVTFGPVINTANGPELGWYNVEFDNLLNEKTLTELEAPKEVKEFIKKHPDLIKVGYKSTLSDERKLYVANKALDETFTEKNEEIKISLPATTQYINYSLGAIDKDAKDDIRLPNAIGANIKLPKFTLTAKDKTTGKEKGHFFLENLSLNFKTQPYKGKFSLSSGSADYTIDKIEFVDQDKNNIKFVLKNLKLVSDTSLKGEFYDSKATFSMNLECDNCPNKEYIPATIDFAGEFNHLDAEAVNIYNNANMKLSYDMFFNKAAGRALGLMGNNPFGSPEVQQALVTIVEKDPEFKITKLAVKTLGGKEVSADLMIKANGLKQADMMSFITGPDNIIKKLQASFNVKIGIDWFDKSPMPIKPFAEGFAKEKLMKFDGKTLEVNFKLDNNKFTLGEVTAEGLMKFGQVLQSAQQKVMGAGLAGGNQPPVAEPGVPPAAGTDNVTEAPSQPQPMTLPPPAPKP